MSPRAARQIRAGILIARQVMRRERLGPDNMYGLTLHAYHEYTRRHHSRFGRRFG